MLKKRPHMLKQRLLALIVSAFLPLCLMSVAFAQPNSSTNEGANLSQLTSHFINVGQAKFKVLFWDIYRSRLATNNGKFDHSHPYLFEITYLRDISREQLIDRTIEQWQHIGVQQTLYQQYLPELTRLWPDIKKGDQLTLLVMNNRALFYYNQGYLGEVSSQGFAKNFVAIWLSKNTSQPQLRQQLLGASDE